jgi:hypothetical protein
MIRRTAIYNAAITGGLDTAQFLLRRPQLFKDNPGRAAGSVAFLAAWIALAASAARDKNSDGSSMLTTGLSAALLAGNAGMLAVHLRHGISSPRVFVGTACSAIALAGAITG